MTQRLELEIPSPLRECFERAQECVPECCGIDAMGSDAETIAMWCREAGPEASEQARAQLAALIAVVNDNPSTTLTSAFLNQHFEDLELRQQLIEFLTAFARGLDAGR